MVEALAEEEMGMEDVVDVDLQVDVDSVLDAVILDAVDLDEEECNFDLNVGPCPITAVEEAIRAAIRQDLKESSVITALEDIKATQVEAMRKIATSWIQAETNHVLIVQDVSRAMLRIGANKQVDPVIGAMTTFRAEFIHAKHERWIVELLIPIRWTRMKN